MVDLCRIGVVVPVDLHAEKRDVRINSSVGIFKGRILEKF